MKLLLTLGFVLFGNLSLASSCPDLGGKYLCIQSSISGDIPSHPTIQNRKINIIQNSSQGKPSYLVKDGDSTVLFRLVTDGKTKETVDNIYNRDVYTTTYCADDRVSTIIISHPKDSRDSSSDIKTFDMYKNQKGKTILKYIVHDSDTVNFIKTDFECTRSNR